MAGLFLFRELEGKLAFDPERVRACIRGVPGIRNWNESNPHKPFFREFDFSGNSTMVYMLSAADLRSISIERMGDASLNIALEIGRCYGVEIHAVDQEYSFNILLSDVTSVAD